jgi:hypothetical protein
MAQPEGRRDGAGRADAGRAGAAHGAGRPRDVRGRRDPPRGPGRWGTWQGGLGVCIVAASAAAGAIATILTRREPGFLLELLVVAGTVAAALAVRPRAGRMILPVPALAYLVAALLSGVIFDRAADSSRTELALAATQWIANGFFAMAFATALALVIVSVRWYLWHRAHRDKTAARDRAPAASPGPARTGSRPPRTGPDPGSRRSRTAWEAPAGSGYPAGYADQRRPGDAGDATQVWGEPGSRDAGPRPGSGPYNFSSGA